jgi:hypothetical protein
MLNVETRDSELCTLSRYCRAESSMLAGQPSLIWSNPMSRHGDTIFRRSTSQTYQQFDITIVLWPCACNKISFQWPICNIIALQCRIITLSVLTKKVPCGDTLSLQYRIITLSLLTKKGPCGDMLSGDAI